jgi:hypothetical protein
MIEISIHELEAEHGQLLPEREALGTSHHGGKTVFADNTATAVQLFAVDSTNTAEATQVILVD